MSKAINRVKAATGLLFPEDEPQPVTAIITPALKWAGGKRWLVPHLLPLWQRFADYRLVEPFVGVMSVALGLQPKRAYLADLNEHLVNFHQWLQKGLIAEGEFIHEETAFYEARARFRALMN